MAMSAQSTDDSRQGGLASPYCADPNCVYCKELREIAAEMRRQTVSAPAAVNGNASTSTEPSSSSPKRAPKKHREPNRSRGREPCSVVQYSPEDQIAPHNRHIRL